MRLHTEHHQSHKDSAVRAISWLRQSRLSRSISRLFYLPRAYLSFFTFLLVCGVCAQPIHLLGSFLFVFVLSVISLNRCFTVLRNTCLWTNQFCHLLRFDLPSTCLKPLSSVLFCFSLTLNFLSRWRHAGTRSGGVLRAVWTGAGSKHSVSGGNVLDRKGKGARGGGACSRQPVSVCRLRDAKIAQPLGVFFRADLFDDRESAHADRRVNGIISTLELRR